MKHLRGWRSALPGVLCVGLWAMGNRAAAQEPIKVGDFIFTPSASLSLTQTDNALLDDSDLSDQFADIAVGAHLQSTWKRHALTADVQHNARRHVEYKEVDQDLSNALLEGRYDASNTWRLLGLLKRDEALVSQANPNREPGSSQQQTRIDTASAQLRFEDARYWGHLLASHEITKNSSEVKAGGMDLSSRMDRWRDDVAFFPGMKIGAQHDRIFGILTRTETTFDAEDPSIRGRDMKGHHLGLGFAREQQTLKLEARLWHFSYRFADAALANVKGIQAYLNTNWQASTQLGLSGLLQRSFEPGTIPGSPGQYNNLLNLGARWALNPQWSVEANAGQTRYQVIDAPIDGSAKAATLGLARALSAHLQARFQLSRTVVDSSVGSLDYTQNLATVQISGRW